MFITLVLKEGTVFAAGSTNLPTTAASTQADTQNLDANWKAQLARFQLDSAILGRVDHALDRLALQPK